VPAPVLRLRVHEDTRARIDAIRGSAAAPALGQHRPHQFPQRARKVTLADMSNAPADADLVYRLSRLRPVRRRNLQVSRGRQPLPPVTVNTPGSIYHPPAYRAVAADRDDPDLHTRQSARIRHARTAPGPVVPAQARATRPSAA
jgi:hypothetical protein